MVLVIDWFFIDWFIAIAIVLVIDVHDAVSSGWFAYCCSLVSCPPIFGVEWSVSTAVSPPLLEINGLGGNIKHSDGQGNPRY